MNFLMGYKEPRFIIKKADTNEIVKVLTLDLTTSGGLIEEDEKQEKTRIMRDYSNRIYHLGWHKVFTLDYQERSGKENTKKIQDILNACNEYHIITLIPRIDDPEYAHDVDFVGGMVRIGIMKGRQNAIGNRLIELKFRTKQIVQNIVWHDPDDIIKIMDFVSYY